MYRSLKLCLSRRVHNVFFGLLVLFFAVQWQQGNNYRVLCTTLRIVSRIGLIRNKLQRNENIAAQEFFSHMCHVMCLQVAVKSILYQPVGRGGDLTVDDPPPSQIFVRITHTPNPFRMRNNRPAPRSSRSTAKLFQLTQKNMI